MATPQPVSTIIGRVTITKEHPAAPNSFWCWLGTISGMPPNVEVGSLLVTEDNAGQSRIMGMVEDLEYVSATPDVILDFYGNGYGDPSIIPPTQPALIRLAKLRVLYRQPTEVKPPEGRFSVRYGTAADVALLAQRIPPDCRVLVGFVRMGSNEADPNNWMPLYAHAEFLLGPEAAHLNISGTSGLATKSSLSIFLAYSVLAWAQSASEPVAVVAFNIKREDFLHLHMLPQSWNQFGQWVTNWAQPIGGQPLADRVQAMWDQARQQGVDPITLQAGVKYFTYQGDPAIQNVPLPPGSYQLYSYGFQDLGPGDFLAGLFTIDEAEQQVNLLSRYLQQNLVPGGTTTFDRMRQDLVTAENNPTGSAAPVRGIGNWNVNVVGALRRRLDGFLTASRAGKVLNKSTPSGSPVRFGALQPNGIHVIQLYGLSDDAKRLVANAVIREIADGLAAPQSPIRRVLVIADELNKFAPAGGSSPIKEQIIDVVARGRDLRFSLAGAQQFASEVDSQVLGNSPTRFIGFTDLGELSHAIYRDLGNFKEQVPNLQKGQMLFRHPVYFAPMLMWFPSPMHNLRPQPGAGSQSATQPGAVVPVGAPPGSQAGSANVTSPPAVAPGGTSPGSQAGSGN